MSVLGLGPMIACALLLAEAAREKLPPPTRAAAMMALLGIALLGMLLVVVILLGGHWVRRQGKYRRGPVVPPDRRPISGRPMAASPDNPLDAEDSASTAETVIRDTRQRGETKPS